MTESGGSVGIRVQAPVLGTVSGVKTLADVIANKPAATGQDLPAVVVRDIDGPAPVTAAAPPAGAETPAKPAPAAPSGGDAEAQARRLVQLAENYANAGMKALAIQKFKDVVEKYPDTDAALTAASKLKDLQ